METKINPSEIITLKELLMDIVMSTLIEPMKNERK